MDPLSITTAVVGLTGVCWQVGTQLRTFRDNVKSVNENVQGLLTQFQSFESVLNSIRETFPHLAEEQATGHIGALWQDVRRSIQDADDCVHELYTLLESINKSVKVLDSARKQNRLQAAAQQLQTFRDRIRSYTDILQLSLNSIVVYEISSLLRFKAVISSRCYRLSCRWCSILSSLPLQ